MISMTFICSPTIWDLLFIGSPIILNSCISRMSLDSLAVLTLRPCIQRTPFTRPITKVNWPEIGDSCVGLSRIRPSWSSSWLNEVLTLKKEDCKLGVVGEGGIVSCHQNDVFDHTD